MSTRIRNSAGVSLVELMVALLIGTVLMLGIVQVFASSRTAYQLSEGVARAQENARFAVDFLQRDVRMAGHFGCVNDQAHLQTPGSLQSHFDGFPHAFAVNFEVSVEGFEAAGTAPDDTLTIGEAAQLPAGLPAEVAALNPLPGSDVLVLRYLSREGAPISDLTRVGSTDSVEIVSGRFDALTSDGVSAPTMFALADCSYVDVFPGETPGGAGVVTVDVAATASPATELTARYTAHPAGQAMLYRAESLVYYVSEGASGEPALYRARYDGTKYVAEELVEGIENMQLLYGLDRVADLSAGPPSGYIDEHSPAVAGWTPMDWRRVGILQVGLLARSPGHAAAGERVASWNVLGTEMKPPGDNDGRFRSVYEVTIAMRNRLYGN